jgi:hypothetical protein
MPNPRFKKYPTDVDSPAEFAYEINVTNDNELPHVTRALYIQTAGNVYCRLYSGGPSGWGGNTSLAETSNTAAANTLFRNVVAGTILPIRVSAVWLSDLSAPLISQTTANCVGLY